jgi:hypothetical protein
MEKQELINAICSLTGVIDALNRSGKKEELTEVVSKLLELIKQL